MTRTLNTYVEKTLMPDVQHDSRQKCRPAGNGLLSLMHLGEVVSLRRVARLFVDGQEAISEDWGAFDHPEPRSHQELNDRMDARATSLAQDWGDGQTPLRIYSAWHGKSELIDRGTPIGFEEEVAAKHAPLFAHAAHLLQTHPDAKGRHNIVIDTDAMSQLPLDKYNVLGAGKGLGTLADPDWLTFESLVTHGIEVFDEAYEWGEPVPAFKLAFEGMRHACLVQ